MSLGSSDMSVMFFQLLFKILIFLVNGVIFILFLSVCKGKCTGDVVSKTLLI